MSARGRGLNKEGGLGHHGPRPRHDEASARCRDLSAQGQQSPRWHSPQAAWEIKVGIMLRLGSGRGRVIVRKADTVPGPAEGAWEKWEWHRRSETPTRSAAGQPSPAQTPVERQSSPAGPAPAAPLQKRTAQSQDMSFTGPAQVMPLLPLGLLVRSLQLQGRGCLNSAWHGRPRHQWQATCPIDIQSQTPPSTPSRSRS